MAKRIKGKEKVRGRTVKMLTDEETDLLFTTIYCTVPVTETHCMRVLDWANRTLFDTALIGAILDGGIDILVPDDPTIELKFRSAPVPEVVPPGQHATANVAAKAADAAIQDQPVVTAHSVTHELARLRQEVRDLRAELDVRQKKPISYFCMNSSKQTRSKQ